MLLVKVCSSFARRVSCAASCFALICCLSSSFSFFFLSFASFLRVHPRQDQAGAAQAISPISMKLGQFEGVHPKILRSKFKEIWSKPGGVDHPPLVFSNNNDQKSPNNWSKVQGSTAIRIQPNLFKFSVNVFLLKNNLLLRFRSFTTTLHTAGAREI